MSEANDINGDLRLNLGCGHVCPKGWTNVDGSNRAWLASRFAWADELLVSLGILPSTDFSRETYYANLSRTFPWTTGSASVVYMGEILEHFTRDDAIRVLKECFRVLKTGGVLRVRVPDNAEFWSNYLQEYRSTISKPRSDWNDAHSRWVEMFFRDICVSKPKAFRSFGHFHKWMYDDASLILLLEEIGFSVVERRDYLDSRIHDVSAIEARDDLIVEAIK